MGAYRRFEQSCCEIFPWGYHQSDEMACKINYGTNPKNIILHCGTNDINDDSDPKNVAEKIVKQAKSISKDCNSNVTVSGIVPRYGKLNEKVRSVNRLLRIY